MLSNTPKKLYRFCGVVILIYLCGCSLSAVRKTGQACPENTTPVSQVESKRTVQKQESAAELYLLNLKAETGDQKAIAELLARAHGADLVAMLYYADLLYLGNGVPQDVQRALQWYMAAVHLGSPRAMLRLGEAYSSGDFIKIDKPKALYWYQSAAKTGFPAAEYELSEVYREGQLVPVDLHLSTQWAIKAADGGYPRAIAFLQDLAAAEQLPQPERQPAIDWLTEHSSKD